MFLVPVDGAKRMSGMMSGATIQARTAQADPAWIYRSLMIGCQASQAGVWQGSGAAQVDLVEPDEVGPPALEPDAFEEVFESEGPLFFDAVSDGPPFSDLSDLAALAELSALESFL